VRGRLTSLLLVATVIGAAGAAGPATASGPAPSPAPASAPAAAPCAGRGTALVVRTGARVLYVCQSGRARAHHAVALGRGGIGKQREGDGRTPLGVYPLGAPRRSVRYGTFIPIGYPTPEQMRQGYTGSAVGLHGPERRSRWLGPLTLMVDWTQGCLAVGSDGAIDAIARWVRAQRPTLMYIE
jgi:hypothetical protein